MFGVAASKLCEEKKQGEGGGGSNPSERQKHSCNRSFRDQCCEENRTHLLDEKLSLYLGPRDSIYVVFDLVTDTT